MGQGYNHASMTNRPSKIVNRQSFWVIIGLVGLAAAVRFPALFANSFHADEALYGSYARLIGTGQDLWLQSTWVDKPPLLFYLQAIFYPLLGTTAPFVARLPNFIASILLVPLVARLVWQLYVARGAAREPATALAEGDPLPPKMDEGEWAGWIAAAFVALSPYTIQFSSTAFLDPLMTMWVVAGLVATSFEFRVSSFRLKREEPQHSALSTQHSVLAGFLFGLAVVTKFQAGLFCRWWWGWGR